VRARTIYVEYRLPTDVCLNHGRMCVAP
jgi:hypothetical protein